jgi:hypothetical protein
LRRKDGLLCSFLDLDARQRVGEDVVVLQRSQAVAVKTPLAFPSWMRLRRRRGSAPRIPRVTLAGDVAAFEIEPTLAILRQTISRPVWQGQIGCEQCSPERDV